MLLRFLAIIAAALCVPVFAGACTCSQAAPGKCAGLQKDDTVFLGTVIATEDLGYGPRPSGDPPAQGSSPVDIVGSRLIRYHFRIDERFALAALPETQKEIDVFSGGDDGDCAFRFKPGEQYLVFTHVGTDARLFSTVCDGTRRASEATALIPQLRAMRDGRRVASVFGILRRGDPPFLAAPDDPDEPLPNISLKLRSRYDRFETSTDSEGMFSFYDVHDGDYTLSATLPPNSELSKKSLTGGLPAFSIPNGACFEYDVEALPTGHIRGTVIGPKGKPLPVASLELYRAGAYSDSRAGLWSFQGSTGFFDFDHIGPGEYILVFNRMNRMDPDAPYPRAFYPGVSDLADAQPIEMKDGEQLSKINLQVSDPYSSRVVRVRLKWQGVRPPASVTVTAKADKGDNPAVKEISDALYQISLLNSANYSISAWEDLHAYRIPAAKGRSACAAPARVDAPQVMVSGSDAEVKEVTLIFPSPSCNDQGQ
jgi:hypothetical protein